MHFLQKPKTIHHLVLIWLTCRRRRPSPSRHDGLVYHYASPDQRAQGSLFHLTAAAFHIIQFEHIMVVYVRALVRVSAIVFV